MKKIVLLALLILLIGCGSAETATTSNITIYHNGSIYTVNPDQPWAEAVAIEDGVIIAVGSEDAVFEQVGEAVNSIDLDGAMMMPGFQDPHLHAIEAGMNENVCFFKDVAAPNLYRKKIQECADETPGEWVRGAGINMAALLKLNINPIEFLDEIVPDRPVLILDDLGHGAWINSVSAEIVGYDKMATDPQGGILARDENGQFTGIILESAQQQVRAAALAPSDETFDLAYVGMTDYSLQQFGRNGITTVSDAGGYWDRDHPAVWQQLLDDDALTVRASNALYLFPNLPFDAQIADLKALYSNNPDNILRFNQIKIYVDGILSQATGALLQPYNNNFGLPGVPRDGFDYFDQVILKKYAVELANHGFQFHFHVTGDRGTRVALDAIEAAQAANPNADLRHRLTHIYLISDADRDRLVDLNVVADFQLAPSSTDPSYIRYMNRYLGNRTDDLLPSFDLLDRGATVTLSSDWDADVLSPLEKIQSVLTLGEPNNPDLATIIEMMTINVAYLLHHDDKTGSIKVGKEADLIVLNQNLFEIEAETIAETKVLLTLLQGEEVYRSASWNGE